MKIRGICLEKRRNLRLGSHSNTTLKAPRAGFVLCNTRGVTLFVFVQNTLKIAIVTRYVRTIRAGTVYWYVLIYLTNKRFDQKAIKQKQKQKAVTHIHHINNSSNRRPKKQEHRSHHHNNSHNNKQIKIRN